MFNNQARRQSLRKGIILVSFLLFPITINYFSPYLIVDSASQGIINGSFISFGLMFLSSLLLGRAWCGWACPAAGLQEACMMVNRKRVDRRANRIKWAIWIPWVALIIWMVVRAGGYRAVDPFYLTEKYISVTDIYNYVVYYGVVLLVVVLSLTVGRRGFCHTVCWMAPFMILGRKIRNQFRWPSLRLTARPWNCKDCRTCVEHCPMSLDVNKMVKLEGMNNRECILCGSCVDNCPEKVIRYTFS